MVFQFIPLASALLPLVADLAPPVMRFLVGDRAGDSVARVSEAASRVATTVEAVTGEPARTPDDVGALRTRLASDPNLRAELAVALGGVEVELERIELQREQAYLEDRADARARDVARGEAGSGSARANLMLLSAFAALIAIVGLLILMPNTTPHSETIVGFVIGIGGMFARNIGSAFDFEFGSSRGSKNKEAMLGTELESARQAASGGTAAASVIGAVKSVQDMAGATAKLRQAIAEA